jgi:hypothetical protein
LIAAAGLSSACVATVSSNPPPPVVVQTGSAVMDWTIDGNKDPAACNATSAATFHVSLYGSNGAFAGEYVQDCSAFATTIDGLAPDTYSGKAELLDSASRPRTTSVNLQPFDVIEGSSSTVALDFPSNSFL